MKISETIFCKSNCNSNGNFESLRQSETLIVNADPIGMLGLDMSCKSPVGKHLVTGRAFVHLWLHVHFTHVASHGVLVTDALRAEQARKSVIALFDAVSHQVVQLSLVIGGLGSYKKGEYDC